LRYLLGGIDWKVFKRGYFFLGVIEATAAMVAFLSFLLLHGWQYGVTILDDPNLHRQAMTMTLLGAISCQLLNAWTMRSWEFSAFSVGLLSNRLLLGAMAAELLWIWMLLNLPPSNCPMQIRRQMFHRVNLVWSILRER